MKLLFINALKGLSRKKVQMASIIFMVMLSTGIYSSMSMALDCMEDRYYNYLETQNVEYLSVDANINYKKDISDDLITKLLNNDLSDDEKQIIYMYKMALDMPDNSSNPLNSEIFKVQLDALFSKYDLTMDLKKQKIDSLKDKYNYDYELDISKTLKEDNTSLKVIPYNKDKKINKAYLIEGKLPTNDNEITMMPKYAKIHDIKIGDKYRIADKDYKVVGFTYAPDYIYPLISFSIPIFDEATNNVVYINKDNYKDIKGNEEKTFSIVYNDSKVKRQFEITDATKEKFDDKSMLKILNNEDIIMSPFTITRLGRIASLQLEFVTDRLFAKYFMYLLLSISIIVITIITKKRIDDERMQIGVLKSLGYSRFSIAVSYLTYPIVGSVIGGILGFLLGVLFTKPVAGIYISYFVIPLEHYETDFIYLLNSIRIPLLFLSILCYLVAIILLKKKPIKLLREGSNLKVNIFSKIINKITSKLPFKYRFKYSIAFRSIPKLLVVAITSFTTGMLIVLTLIGMDLMDTTIDKTFSGMKYNYLVIMNNVEKEKIDSNSDYVLNTNLILKEVEDRQGKVRKIKNKKDDVVVSINGIDLDSKSIDIFDKKNKSIKEKLNDDNCIIINSNTSELYDINVDDKLTFKVDDTTSVNYNVCDIAEEYMNYTAYVNRDSYSKKLGFKESVYTTIYSKNKEFANMSSLDDETSNKIATVLNFVDLKNSIKKSLDKYNGTIYIIIAFASIMAFVIILVIANIIVEENKKTISLMKVMGYKNKEISGVVLNIYTPIIIISYLLSIPVMIKFLEKVISLLSDDTELTIPITLSYQKAFIGLVFLLGAYYIALAICKRVLNKIPLAVALKRE